MTTRDNGFDVYGAIERKWIKLGAAGGLLGHPVTPESDTVDHFGRAQNFEKGMVSWYHGSSEAFAVYGLIGERWLQLGREAFGYPIVDESDTGDRRGRYNHFRGYNPDETFKGEASIFFLPEVGAHEVYGAIRDKWAEMGWERSPAGYPISPERDRRDGPGREQQFQHGRFTWAPGASGAIYDAAGLPPHLHLAAVNSQAVVSGDGFTPAGKVEVKLMAKSGSGPSHTSEVAQVITANGDGAFFRTTFSLTSHDISQIVFMKATARDFAANQDAEPAILEG